ncbi:cysteine synthase family protein [Sphingomonas sp. MMS12-HWE2-04]|uniref:cysteine synthase family protein n=1 Tax=Sphingomonas sp. MMS12-HWE2-04 TaxID=3234199 RepID=UPI00384DAA18
MGAAPIFELGSEALKPPRLLRLAPNFYVAIFGIMKLYPASYIIRQAEARREIGPHTLVVETTSGTFGLALAMVCAERGHRLWLVGDGAIDATLRDRILGLGADISIVTEPAAVGGMQQARLNLLTALRRDHEDHFWPAQYENPDNSRSYAELAEMLHAQLGQIDCLIGTVGTGGSMCGTAAALGERCPGLHVVGVDTHGSVLFGQPDRPGRLLRGLGNSLLPRNVVHTAFDEVHWVSAADAFSAAHELHRRHALFMGPTSGAAWLAARWWAHEHPDRQVVAILPDEGHRYMSTVYDREWLAARGLGRAALPSAPVTVDTPGFEGEGWSRFGWHRRRIDEVLAGSEIERAA